MLRRRISLTAVILACVFPAVVAGQPVVLKPPDGVKYAPDVTYRQTDTGPLRLDIAYPSQGAGPFPVVVILHGTGVSKGRKANVPLAFQLAQKGYVGVAVTFRHTAKDPYPAAIKDAWAAVRWVRKNAGRYRIDPQRIAALGYSGGGALACLLGMTEDSCRAKDAPSSQVQAVVAYYPLTDLARLHDDCGKNRLGIAGTLFIRPSLAQWLGGIPAQVKERYAAASPVTHVHKKMAPLLLLHGTDDKLVPAEQSQLLADRAALKGGKATLLLLPGAGHLFDGRGDDNTLLAAAMAQVFLDRHLRASAGHRDVEELFEPLSSQRSKKTAAVCSILAFPLSFSCETPMELIWILPAMVFVGLFIVHATAYYGGNTNTSKPEPVNAGHRALCSDPYASPDGKARRRYAAAGAVCAIRPALMMPPCITAMKRGRSSSIAMSASTSPSTTSTSASLPGSSVPNSLAAAHDLGAGPRGAGDHLQRRKADVVDEESQLLGVVAVRVPGEAVVAAHAEPAAGLQDPAGALGAAFQRLLVAVDDALRHAEARAFHDAGVLELQGRHHRRVRAPAACRGPRRP